ncbi:ABC transporter ATP-binding protein [Vineibacter terrae]|uniref:ABC transporter ATP-binding protein n=1 Tax=Vineibacter terrae TaxID=2586908 RepID=UPI002E30A2AC|nr:ABC transporter ATP-binding protein [Vineibacter terrae]HEX2890324.1 ABC transporter ATP-binding protein [Vineibacter terrae]
MIRLRDVHLDMASAAGTVNILRGIDLDVPTGGSTALVGPSGAGKSSLMMVVGGLERATSGTIEVADTALQDMSDDALARFRRDNLGIVFQGFHLIPTMTATENVALPLEFAGVADAFARAEAALRDVGLGHRLTHYPAQLSGGEQQRVAVARAFATRPKLLLADEPTGNLDGATGRQVMTLLFDLTRNAGATLLLITHDPSIAEQCDRVIHIADGRIAADTAMTPA